MNTIIETSMKTYFKLRSYTIELWNKTPIASQEVLLHELIATAKYTEFGKKYSFREITSLQGYQDAVPIHSYNDIEPYITRMQEGASDILWPGSIRMFSKSSGTTNDVSKYVPVSHASLYQNNYSAGKDIYSLFFDAYPDSDLFKNKGSVFSLGGSFITNKHGIKVGDISAIIMSELPAWAEEYREPSIETSLIEHWKEKIPKMIEETIDKNITHLSGVPTWFVSIFEEMKKNHPYTNLRDIWPNLELFIHGAVSFGPYQSIFDQLLPFDDMKYMEVYNASEGFFAIQDDPNKKGEMLLLTNHGIFYEFIPMKEYGTETRSKALSLKNVKTGVDYAMIISTNAGLWRYDIGDTVCFTSTNPYRIKISGRTKHFINVFGEELMVGNSDQSLQEACKQTGAMVEHYSAGPIFMNDKGKGGHQWIIEFKTEPNDITDFKHILDQSLQNLNSDYKAKRQDNIALQELTINAVPKGTFMKWMEERGKMGGQHKVPRLSNTRKYIEELLEI